MNPYVAKYLAKVLGVSEELLRGRDLDAEPEVVSRPMSSLAAGGSRFHRLT